MMPWEILYVRQSILYKPYIYSDENNALVSLSNAYVNADHFSTRRQILSIVAADVPVSILKAYFPGITMDLIKEARDHAYYTG